MTSKPAYLSFMLRLWQAEENGRFVWRASLENPHTSHCLSFPETAALYAFLEAEMAANPNTRLDVACKYSASDS